MARKPGTKKGGGGRPGGLTPKTKEGGGGKPGGLTPKDGDGDTLTPPGGKVAGLGADRSMVRIESPDTDPPGTGKPGLGK